MRTVELTHAIDLLTSWQPLVASRHDPTIRVRATRAVRASHTPHGAGTLLVEQTGPRTFTLEAWGSGAGWLLEQAPQLLGADDVDRLDPSGHRAVAAAAKQRPGLRLIRTGQIHDVLVPAILGQRVTVVEAARSWTRLVRRLGAPAPGPYPLRLPPTPAQLAELPEHAFHLAGVERRRARTVIGACRAADRLQAALEAGTGQAAARLRSLPGIGPWTTALVLRAAAGDPDQVEVGDYHLKNVVAYNLAGEPRGDDERMLELLAPFAGQRGRVVRLLTSAGARPPTYGPRQRIVPVETL